MRVIWETMKLQIKNSFARSTFKFTIIIQPIIFATLLYMIYKDSGINGFLSYVVLGSGIMSLWSSIVFSSAGDIERERYMGNLEILGVTKTPFTVILYGKILGNTVLGFVTFLISFLWITVIFGEVMIIKSPIMFLIGFLAMTISFMLLAVILALIFTASRSAQSFMNCFEYPIYILTGMVFPLSVLPEFFVPISWILSPTWAIKVLRLATNGFDQPEVIGLPLLILLLISLLYYFFGIVLYRIVNRKTRTKGTLGVY